VQGGWDAETKGTEWREASRHLLRQVRSRKGIRWRAEFYEFSSFGSALVGEVRCAEGGVSCSLPINTVFLQRKKARHKSGF